MSIDDATRLVLRARERVLSAPQSPAEYADVRPEILNSWRRSLLFGLDPDRCVPTPIPSTETNGLIKAAAAKVVATKSNALSQSSCSLALTDSSGRLLERWVSDHAFASLMDKHSLVPDVSVAESSTGTGSSGIVLETGRPVTVAGPEHFNEGWLGLTCAGAPIRHPATRRLLGTLNLTVRYSDTSSILLAWVTDVAAEIERALATNVSEHDHLLFDAYTSANREARHPVLCLNGHTSITNTHAARLLSPVDQVVLWEVASKLLASPTAESTVTLASGDSVGLDVRAVTDGRVPIGAVIRLHLDRAPTRREAIGEAQAPVLAGLVGVSDLWTMLCRRATEVGAAPVMVTGEPGSGKTAVATALDPSRPRVVDAADDGDWLATLAAACDSPGADHVIVTHLNRLDARLAPGTADLLSTASRRGVRISATITTPSGTASTVTALSSLFGVTLAVPALSERPEDIAPLLQHLTRRRGSNARWSVEAVHTMMRVDWPRNVASLDEAVGAVLATIKKLTVESTDLPPDLRARASRRMLTGLERVEAKAILDAVRSAAGNKRLAAQTLGIARSTLYRKARSLGIDVDAPGT